jgi:ElaB/YqjD/DUF883 family membrane-anchored ribosome-binding protein
MDTATTDKQGLASSLRRMIDEADGLLKSATRTGDEAFDTLHDQFTDQVKQMREQLDELEETAVYRARRAARAADRGVHEHPYGAMGAAAALGLLVGVLIARR